VTMCRARRSWCRKIVQFNLRATLFTSWALGLFPFIYNSKAQSLQRSRWLVAYGILLNTGIASLILYDYSPIESPVKMDLYRRNPLAERITNLHYLVVTSTVFVIHFQNWWQSEKLETSLNMLWGLHMDYFKEYDSMDCSNFDIFIICKGLAIVFELVSTFALDVGFSPEFSVQYVFTFICVLTSQISVLLIGMHFHLAIIHIYRFVWIINQKLLEVLYSQSSESAQIHHLHCLYRRLLEINLRLVAIYSYLTILFIMCILTANISAIYYFLVYAHSLKGPVPFYMILNIIQVVLINTLDFWLHIMVCEWAERASRETTRILKLFTDVPVVDVSLDSTVSLGIAEKSVIFIYISFSFQLNDFAMFCSYQRLEYNNLGLFNVHHAMGFRMIITSALYLLYLVQFDYMNI
ncbi:hypothetical protein KR222_009506, partial [Zaprionus bogoriensis]